MSSRESNPSHVDGRSLSIEALEQRRREVIEIWSTGASRRYISEELGLSYSAVVKITNRYAEQGEASFAVCRRGAKPGSRRLLTKPQELSVQETIATTKPQAWGLEDERWSCPAVQRFIETHYGLELTERTVWNYLHRWNVPCRKKAPAGSKQKRVVSRPMAPPSDAVQVSSRVRMPRGTPVGVRAANSAEFAGAAA